METSRPSQEQSGVASDLPPINDIGIHRFYEFIGEHPPGSVEKENRRDTGKNGRRQQSKEVANERTEPPAKKQKIATEHLFGTLQEFISVLKSSLKDLTKNELKVYKYDDRALTDNPSAIKIRTDVVIRRRDYSLSHDEVQVPWGSIEMAIEYHSAEKTREQCLEQVVTCIASLLQVRPDLVSALGLLVEPDSLDFFFCNTNGINRLSLSNEDDYMPLLSTVMRYLNGGQKKNLDPTLSRREGTVLYDVSIPNGNTSLGVSEGTPTLYERCSLRYSQDPLGRRPNIFVYKPENDVAAIRVIKYQYVRRDSRWMEKHILDKIHADGPYPAVVRMGFADEVIEARCGDCIRVRIGLQDYGTNFLSLKTPRDVIYALYDLLEVTRSLYFDRKILHRDISPYNVMIRDSRYTQDIQTCSSSSPVFIQHLLNPKEPKHKSSIFLIDFGYSQDLESSKSRRGGGRTGTPMFIARAVQADKPLPGSRSMYFPDLPPLSEGIKAAYRSAYPKRMESFNEPLGVQMGPSNNPPSSPFRHKLEHDGESGIWCFSWWSILAFPEKAAEVPIDITNWTALLPQYGGKQFGRTGLHTADNRNMVLHQFIERKSVLHPGYGDLHKLFENISEAILPDYHWAKDSIRQKPDFVHEILQRIILNFVAENMNEPFMDKKKADENRTVEGTTSTSHLSASSTESFRSASSTRKRKSKESIPDPMPPIPAMADTDEFNDNENDGSGDPDDEDTRRFEKKSRTDDVPVINVRAE